MARDSAAAGERAGLPSDESKLGDLTLPQVLVRHRQDKTRRLYEHFDSIGLTFEGFGPIGERRALDLGGKPVENHAAFRDGSKGTGLDGLRKYLHSRQNEFVDNLCRKLLADALGRTLQLSDEPTIEQMARSSRPTTTASSRGGCNCHQPAV